ncbi:aldo/keto reductase [Periweissella fabalis]|uniref:Aldo/keto reductase n=1 Tax=Periweissella fabalis TaxID=1070421 RepID=A0A7X6N1J8_9LACO|nr:aldo/keto reductase [Periweissella fabalis]MCM0598572.1 aldo/keto reductase [Periweissella fabalis]NKZ24146.1 aldo/keto reductase [Periweissella fabalis]
MVFAAADDRYEKLPYRRVADTGMILPTLSFGLWRNLGDEKPLSNSREVILKAFDNGIFSFDNASNYGPTAGSAEETFGAVFEKDLKPYRNELVITTKAGFHMWPGPFGEFTSKKTMVQALDLSLKRMHLDYVDIFYAHRFDPETNIREVAESMDLLVRQGKALYVGVSNYTTEQFNAIAEIFSELGTPFVGNQVSYNMLNREIETDGLLEAAENHHAGVIAYGPLAEGLLTDRYLNGIPSDMPLHWSNKLMLDQVPEQVVSKLNALNDLAHARGQQLSQLALAWLLKDDRVPSVIIGASSVNHLLDNVRFSDNMTLSDSEIKIIDDILSGK